MIHGGLKMEVIFNTNVDCVSNLDWAMQYVNQGWSVIPLYEADIDGHCSCGKKNCTSVGKHPRVKNGSKDGSSDPLMVKKWWNIWPNANIGIVTGSASKICVLDIDPKNGGLDSLSMIQEKYGPLMSSSVRSGGQGKHFYFSILDDSIKNHVNIYPGIDIRGEGGYIVAPPSRHKSGDIYQWERLLIDQVPAPDFLKNIDALKDKKSKNTQSENKFLAGSRNNFLTSVSGYLLRQGMQHSAIEEVLMVINKNSCNPSLPLEEVKLIAKSIQRYKEEVWPDLEDIIEPEIQLCEMSEELLPDNLKDWILDIALRMQIPIDFIAIPVIVSISAVIGRKFRIYPKKNDDWIVVPNLWGGIISRPGTLKSPAIAEALKPLESIVKRENIKYIDEIADWEINQTINHATSEAFKDHLIRAIKKGNLDEAEAFKYRMKKNHQESSSRKPAPKRLKTNDTTVEKLVELLLD
ncbi:MAG: DUF3987 domain-containing protein, partial [Gammaproteobacteria bacterium]|nr:DUF3987 domain-containing protein [Gammaproteobacteria bacterium]